MLMMRFDMRMPGKTAPQMAEQYRAAIEMARWVDDKGACVIGLSEHHVSEDGYTSSPLVLASSMAAVTRNVQFMVAAALLPMYDPVRLAEDMIVLDYISRGRVSYILGIGYRPVEYELYGLDFRRRGEIADQKLGKLLALLREAAEGEAMPRVTPGSFTPGRPPIMWGGATSAAARRAGRNGLAFYAQTSAPGLAEAHAQAARDAGFEPPFCMLPPPEMPSVVFVHPDPDVGWEEVGPYLLADAVAYADWNRGTNRETRSLSFRATAEEMRAEQGSYRVLGVDEAVAFIERWGRLPLHPLCGGCPPELAWTYLRRVVEQVVPAVAAAASGPA